MRTFRKAAVLGVVVAALGIGLRPTSLGFWLEEDVALWWLFTVRGSVDPPPEAVVVSIDRASSDQLGLDKEDWPPPRHVHASVIRSLTRHGASAIVMDVFFRVRRTPAEDADLANAIAESGRVILFESVARRRYPGGDIAQTRLPIEQFRRVAFATGPFPLPEGDAVRFFWTFFEAPSGKVPTLPAVALQVHALPHLRSFVSILREAGVNGLADFPSRVIGTADLRQAMRTLRRQLDSRPDQVRRALRVLDRRGIAGMTAGERRLLTALLRLYGGSDTRYLNLYGPAGRIRTVPFHELLSGGDDAQLDLKGTIVFVGEGASRLPSLADQRDTYRTVFSHNGVNLSGAEIAATAFANLLTERTVTRVRFFAEVAILACFAVVAAALARMMRGLYGAAAIVTLGCAHYAVAQYLFSQHAILVPLGTPLLVQAPVTLFADLFFRYRNVRKQVPREVDGRAAPELLEGVCLSTDIENYVTASAGMNPGDLARLMGEYYDTLAKLVARGGGLMMGRAGDSAMCVWTAERSARGFAARVRRLRAFQRRSGARIRANACQTALEIRESIDRFNERHATPLQTRIGLHVGHVAIGPVGGEFHVIGDVPNTASRIEGLNKQVGTTILASAPVVYGQEGLCLRPIGRFLLAGRPGQVAIVEIVGRKEAVTQATSTLCERFAEALASFETGDLAQAERQFLALAADYPSDGPTRYYRHLCVNRVGVALPGAGAPPFIRIDTK